MQEARLKKKCVCPSLRKKNWPQVTLFGTLPQIKTEVVRLSLVSPLCYSRIGHLITYIPYAIGSSEISVPEYFIFNADSMYANVID